MVARTLVDGQRARAVRAEFAYGYGPGGGTSPLEDGYRATRTGSKARAALNMMSHDLLGEEALGPTGAGARGLEEQIHRADVVHLHVIHSYFLRPTRLLAQLAAARKPVVWTLHDQWAMTGRCAQPAGCVKWRTGCSTCPDLRAYPPARLDRAESNWEKRRLAIDNLATSVPLALVACAEWLGQEARLAGLPGVRVIQNSVDQEFWSAIQSQKSARRSGLLFMCRDLRDRAKVDWEALKAIDSRTTGRLTVVGDNAPAILANATHLPSVSSRTEVARLMAEHSSLIFTSKVDYYPLTVLEALASGMRVFAIDSPAAQEFARHPNMRIFSVSADLVSAVSVTNVEDFVSADRSMAPDRMVEEYIGLYQELVGAGRE